MIKCVVNKCSKCQGYGCPACLGTGSGDAKRLVEEWGARNGHAGITPERVYDLPVTEQREVQGYVRRHLQQVK